VSSQPTIFDDARMTSEEAIELTAASLREYGARHDVWSVAFSGGKDSTAMVTLVVHLIETGRVPRPRKMYVLYGDTRMELPPLWLSAQAIMADLAKRDWIECRTVMAEMDQRFFVYMLGRGVPPPNNNTLRWCTAQIKVEPMEMELRRLAAAVEQSNLCCHCGKPAVDATDNDHDGTFWVYCRPCDFWTEHPPQKPLMLIGVRIGESAARDARIAVACSRNGAECGQGWYQRDLPDAVCDKLSPLLHFRTCLIWDWLMGNDGHDSMIPPGMPMDEWLAAAPARKTALPFHGFPTKLVAVAYGVDEEDPADSNARTGCVGCPLATRDLALENLLRVFPEQWGHLAPLLDLRAIYRELREPKNRLRQPPGEMRKDGKLTSNQNRMGPLTMEARRWALLQILAIQTAVNAAARAAGRPEIDILNASEVARIEELMSVNQWPNGWTGDEPLADELYEDQYIDGSRQLLLPILPGDGK